MKKRLRKKRFSAEVDAYRRLYKVMIKQFGLHMMRPLLTGQPIQPAAQRAAKLLARKYLGV